VLILETKILRALCNPAPPLASLRAEVPAARATILAALSGYSWQAPEHRVVFEALTLLPSRDAKVLREQLPAQATRMGFPDVNWDAYFAAEAEASPIESLVAELLAASPNKNPRSD
jgi:hypothetical protein